MLSDETEEALLLNNPRPELAAFGGRRNFHQAHADRLGRCTVPKADEYRQKHLKCVTQLDAVLKVERALAQYHKNPMKNRHQSAVSKWLAAAGGSGHPPADVARVQAALVHGGFGTTTDELIVK
jgi:hypothetical protein